MTPYPILISSDAESDLKEVGWYRAVGSGLEKEFGSDEIVRLELRRSYYEVFFHRRVAEDTEVTQRFLLCEVSVFSATLR